MSTPDRLSDEAVDRLLDGAPSDDVAGSPLAEYVAAMRDDSATAAARPSQELAVVLAEGLAPADLAAQGILTATTDDGILTRGILTMRHRGRTALRVLVTKFAALGLLTKAAAAGAAVTVAASGAGVAGVLPPPAQHAFDTTVGREVAESVQDEQDQSDDTTGEAGDAGTDTPADTSSTKPLDTDVSDDATGTSDGEPGVDGGEIADDASDGRSGVREDAPADGPGPAEDATADRRPQEVPPTGDTPPAGPVSDGTDGAAEQGDVEERPNGSPPSPADGSGARD